MSFLGSGGPSGPKRPKFWEPGGVGYEPTAAEAAAAKPAADELAAPAAGTSGAADAESVTETKDVETRAQEVQQLAIGGGVAMSGNQYGSPTPSVPTMRRRKQKLGAANDLLG